MPDTETIDVGARVRFKGDHSAHPLWMTVTRKDVDPPGPNGPIKGSFLTLMWPVASERRLDEVRAVQSVMEGAVTTEEHEQSSGPKVPAKRRTR
jgi:hypothetical protein